MDWRTPVTLTGKYVRLEPMTEAHVAGPGCCWAGRQDLGVYVVWRYAHGSGYRRIGCEIFSRGRIYLLRLSILASGRVAGATRYLNITPEHRGLEIGGTWYGLEFQRTAVNTECKYLLLQYAFETLGCIRVQFKTDLRNERSQRAIERIGAKREGVLRNHMILPDGSYRHSLYYSILDAEWPEVKKRLEEKLER